MVAMVTYMNVLHVTNNGEYHVGDKGIVVPRNGFGPQEGSSSEANDTVP